MKVIEVGNWNNLFPMRVKCERIVDANHFSYGDTKDFCGSVLEIEIEDIERRDWSKYPDYKGYDYGITCPICGKFIPISEDILPESVIKAVDAKKGTPKERN
ncbi:MAG: hypothetical protein IJ419_13615 [Agathobacter sp.]|nr:hypothetical protein [Agathobacter sp.]